jgi:indole-3-glycerol phosphate synthase
MSVLKEICDQKHLHVTAQKNKTSLADLRAQIKSAQPPRGFLKTLQNAPFPAIIAEIKKASPSKGIIREDFNPTEIAQIYKDNGAACLSVLTDEPYFQGSDAIFKSVRTISYLPLLRKDFIVDPYQIYESRALGADCILIIMAALTDDEAASFHALAHELGMDALVEVHNAEELERAKLFNPNLIGVNNRNLKTLEVSVQTSRNLANLFPSNAHKIAESGLADAATLKDLQAYGYGTFLIGESLMRQPDIGAALQNIRRT